MCGLQAIRAWGSGQGPAEPAAALLSFALFYCTAPTFTGAPDNKGDTVIGTLFLLRLPPFCRLLLSLQQDPFRKTG